MSFFNCYDFENNILQPVLRRISQLSTILISKVNISQNCRWIWCLLNVQDVKSKISVLWLMIFCSVSNVQDIRKYDISNFAHDLLLFVKFTRRIKLYISDFTQDLALYWMDKTYKNKIPVILLVIYNLFQMYRTYKSKLLVIFLTIFFDVLIVKDI